MSKPVWRRAILPVLIILSACGAEDPIPRRVKARLESIFENGPKEPTPDEVRVALLRQLRTAAAFPSRKSIDDFYAKHGHRLVWSDPSGKLLPTGTALLDALRRAGDHGLNPDDYAVDRLDSLQKGMASGGAERLADFDLLLTSAFFRYASDLSTGRLHPDEVQSGWHTNPTELDVAAALDEALAKNDLTKLLESLPPPHPGYARLRQSLLKLREIDAAGGWPEIPKGPKKVGPSDPRSALLQKRLDQQDVAAAIRSFQSLHAIDPDGSLNEETLAAMNVPVGERIRQVELNLERWRWAPRDLGDPHVLVNIPGYDLELERADAQPWRTRVVAGKAYTPTPVFSDRIVALVIHPPWNVPESIAVKELLPELLKNPNALDKQHIRVLEGSGDKAREVDPGAIRWKDVDPERFPYRLRQDPGDANPLGHVKFDLTNDFSIYLHDTPAGAVFGRADRDVSHGCIRVEKALDLASRITSDAEKEKMKEALEQPEEQRIELQAKIPVHILYFTAWADGAGNLHFGPDVYDFDRSQRAALDKLTSSQPDLSEAGLHN